MSNRAGVGNGMPCMQHRSPGMTPPAVDVDANRSDRMMDPCLGGERPPARSTMAMQLDKTVVVLRVVHPEQRFRVVQHGVSRGCRGRASSLAPVASARTGPRPHPVGLVWWAHYGAHWAYVVYGSATVPCTVDVEQVLRSAVPTVGARHPLDGGVRCARVRHGVAERT